MRGLSMAACASNYRFFVTALVVAVLTATGPVWAQTAKNSGTTSSGAVYNSTKSSGDTAAPTGGVYNSSKKESAATPLFTKRETAGALPPGMPTGKSYGMKGTQVTKPTDPDKLYKDNQAAKAAQAQQNASERSARAAQIKAQFEAQMKQAQKKAEQAGASAGGATATTAQAQAQTNPADPYNGANVVFTNPRAEKDKADAPRKLFNSSR
ncbi:hypothetical protein [Micavibrio aeruginosavorus]|uniref:hypothetical protein n=1 Tax=Micavibrio aeruginosavorus TaxID=349221 RepID=UPI003F4AB266